MSPIKVSYNYTKRIGHIASNLINNPEPNTCNVNSPFPEPQTGYYRVPGLSLATIRMEAYFHLVRVEGVRLISWFCLHQRGRPTIGRKYDFPVFLWLLKSVVRCKLVKYDVFVFVL